MFDIIDSIFRIDKLSDDLSDKEYRIKINKEMQTLTNVIKNK